ncbi:DUF2285 domain-containing protein [Acetobacter indonesiensis]|uniref:DUF2285 domain-containing protein n=1 Tax=Acetobacter indonesiensis TaxID=104101 RepID=UPI0015C503CE|nr:DUF2285 domain-containing protein [Acetobacter indonesiensis]
MPVIWRPGVTSSIISLTHAVDGFTPPALPTWRSLGRPLFDRADHLGRAIVVATPSATFSLSLHGEAAACPAVHIPVDPSYRRRSDEAARFCAHVMGYRLPARHPRRITPARWRQLALRLHAFDLDAAGASLRDIASELLDLDTRTMPDDIWRDSALRTMARALRDEGSALVHGGYLALLDGL